MVFRQGSRNDHVERLDQNGGPVVGLLPDCQYEQAEIALAPGDVVITPAVDRLSRDTTDLLVIACEMQFAGAGIRSLPDPFLDTTSDLPRSP